MPTSVLWVTLIGVWLFVLVPMVLRGRPQARKTTEAAANTRVVHRGGTARKGSTRTATRARVVQRAAANATEQALQRKADAAKADAAEAAAATAAEDEANDMAEDDLNQEEVVPTIDGELVENDDLEGTDLESADLEGAADDADADVEEAEIVDIDVEIDEIDVVSAAELTDQIPVVTDAVVDLDEAQAHADLEDVEPKDELDDAEYDEEDEYDEEADYEDEDDVEETEEVATDAPVSRELRGRGGYGPDRLAEREQMQYRERQRMILALAVLTLGAIIGAFFIQPWGILAAVAMVGISAMYLFFLRKTVRQEHIRQAQRAARRRRQQAEDERLETVRSEPTYVEPPARLRKPGGAIVLEIDDEDPAFDHLPTFDFAYASRNDDEFSAYDEYVGQRQTAV